mmetsp:Transcript_17241/g.34987  ORF Transcript_17241/g.34987 Transcript_17241/m.34987 type:complete len:81 (-) Transcript_17241:543-785(-)
MTVRAKVKSSRGEYKNVRTEGRFLVEGGRWARESKTGDRQGTPSCDALLLPSRRALVIVFSASAWFAGGREGEFNVCENV